MSRKTEAAYKAVFEYINENVMSLECDLFMTDFEQALRNGLASVVSNTKFRCCWFHYCQACKRCVRKLEELIPVIKEGEGKEIYHRLLCLPLLPAGEILNAFQALKQKAFAINADAFKRFFTYYENQWLKNVTLCL